MYRLQSQPSKKACGEEKLRKYLVSLNHFGTKIKRMRPSNKPGWPPVLTFEEEKVIVECIELMCGWGFLLDGSDLRHLVKIIWIGKKRGWKIFRATYQGMSLLFSLAFRVN